MKIKRWYMVKGLLAGLYVSPLFMPADGMGDGSRIAIFTCAGIGLAIGTACDHFLSRRHPNA